MPSEMAGEILKPGTPAPEFSLHAMPDQTVSLSDFRGQPVVLAFYPADWSPVCGDQIALYNERIPPAQRRPPRHLGRRRLVPQRFLSAPPSFFINGIRHDGAWDADMLTDAFRRRAPPV